MLYASEEAMVVAHQAVQAMGAAGFLSDSPVARILPRREMMEAMFLMPRWLLWTPVAALTVATAVLGLHAGWHVSNLTEADVINKAAQAYVKAAEGHRERDCAATPSQDRSIWLIVTCTPAAGASLSYHGTRFGKVVLGEIANAAPEI